LSDTDQVPQDPAVGLLEFVSIAVGLVAGDAMVKSSPVGSIYAGTVHPGKYLVLVSGDTASVDEAMQAGREIGGASIVGEVFLPNIHPAVVGAIVIGEEAAWADDDALGIVEASSVAVVIDAADAGVKAALVEVAAIRLADGLGGKGYLLFSGVVAEVEAAMEAAVLRAEPSGAIVESRIIPQLHEAMAVNLRSDLRFMKRVELRPEERGT
jgi:microcompartment protein CcmL/EutN